MAPTFIVRKVMATNPRSNVAAGLRSSGRLPRYVYGLVLSTMVKKPSSTVGPPAPQATREVRLLAVVQFTAHVRTAA
jgi:hypothetical protein